MRRALLSLSLVAAVLASCSTSTKTSPPPCNAIAAPDNRWPQDIVWGFADLHTHPAIELAFEERFIWGTVLDANGAEANELTPIDNCPVETHDHDVKSPLERAVGVKIFPIISELGGYAHAPVGSVSHAWPNARDVIHEAMSVSGIRRAYEGGLRLIFAAPTHDQAIAGLLRGANVSNGFVPDGNADHDSAKKQLALIRQIVTANSRWMQIVATPDEARTAIAAGKLAVVLSLEMNGLTVDQTNDLIDHEGARHIIPVHLIDNDVGGSAASGDLFNLSGSAHTPLYRDDGKDLVYMSIAATPRYSRPNGWPLEVYSLMPIPLYIEPDEIPYARYAGLCYEPLDSCATTMPLATEFTLLGEENTRGICTGLDDCGIDPNKRKTGEQRMRDLMLRASTLVDVTHMGHRSVRDSIRIAGELKFPLIASHGDVNHLCENPAQMPCTDDLPGPINERAIEADYARTLVDRHGVLGLGTGTGQYASRAVLASRAGPLFALTPGSPSACVARGNAPGCARAPAPEPPDPTMPITELDIATIGGVPTHILGNARPFVRVEMRDGAEPHSFQRHVFVQPMGCTAQGCSAQVMLGKKEQARSAPLTSEDSTIASCLALQTDASADAYTVDDILSVTLEWEFLQCDAQCQMEAGVDLTIRQCRNTADVSNPWLMNEIALTAGATTIAHFGPTDPPVITLDKDRGRFVVFDRTDRPSAGASVAATGHLLKIAMKSGSLPLQGASTNSKGSNVCVALRKTSGADCVSIAPPIDPKAEECPPGWTSINQRGTWGAAGTLYGFARFDDDERKICGLDVSVLAWSQPSFEIDDVRIDAIEDPFGRFVRRYAEVSRQIAKNQPGIWAFGTDFNGLNGLIDISEFGMPDDARTASICPLDGVPEAGAPGPLAPLRMKGTGEKILVEQRGLATYGLLADMMAIIQKYPGCGTDVHTSLMLSAERTLRTWEWITNPTAAAAREERVPLPALDFKCGDVPK